MAVYNAAHTLQILAVMQHFVSNIVYSIHKKANFLTANCKKTMVGRNIYRDSC